MNSILKYCCILIFVIGFNQLKGQTTLQVVTKTIEKTIPYKDGNELNIEGDKAEILVESWDKNEVKVVASLIAKHPNKSVAEKDLEYMVYDYDQHGDKIYFRNYVSVPKGKAQPESNLSAVYTITLPADCPVYVKNNFGLTNVSNLTNYLRINSNYSKTWLENLKGKIGVDTYFGDLEGRFIDGDVTINSRRADITLREITGSWQITSHYGILKLFTNPDDLLSLNIDAEKSDVFFFDPKPDFYGYTLTAHYGNIIFPNDLKFNFLENTQATKKAIFSSQLGKGNVAIKISFGDIVIRNP